MWRRKRLLEWRERLPQREGNEASEAADKRADDFGIVRGQCCSVDDADKDEGRSENKEDGADIVEFLEGLLRGEASRVFGREVV